MNELQPFTCPCCGLTVSYKEIFIFKKDHITICKSCSSPLEPANGKSFQWGFFIGVLGFLIPAETIKYIYNSSILAFLCGVIGGILTFLLGVLYIRKRTFFKLKTI